jgi:hypothetical protein
MFKSEQRERERESLIINKMKTKNTTLPEQFENPIEKISHANRGKIRSYQHNQDAP